MANRIQAIMCFCLLLFWVGYCMVCAYVREDNPRALASGLSPVHMHNHKMTALLHQHACALRVL